MDTRNDRGYSKPDRHRAGLGDSRMSRLAALGGAHMLRGYDLLDEASGGGTHVERCGGAAFQAASSWVTLGHEATLLSLRGGDSAGRAVADAAEEAGIEDASVTFLTRASPIRMMAVGSDGALVASLADDALYDRRFASQIGRRAWRNHIAGADALVVDDTLGEAALTRLTQLIDRHFVTAIAERSLSALTGMAPRLSCVVTAAAGFGDPARLMAALRAGGFRTGLVAGGAALLGFTDREACLVTADLGGDIDLRDDLGMVASAASLALLDGADIASTARFAAAAALANSEAALSPARLPDIVDSRVGPAVPIR